MAIQNVEAALKEKENSLSSLEKTASWVSTRNFAVVGFYFFAADLDSFDQS